MFRKKTHRIIMGAIVLMWALIANHVATDGGLKIVDSIQEGDTVRYAYVGPEVPGLLEDGEVPEKRTESSYTVYLGKDEQDRDVYRTRTYSQPTFVRDGLAWHVVEYGEDTQEAFLAKTKSSVASHIARAIVPPTYAVTIFSHSGDGGVEASDSSWAAARGATTGEVTDDTWCPISTCLVVIVTEEGGSFGIARTYVPFDTSSIPSGASVTAASLNVFVTNTGNEDNDGNDFITVVRTSQTNYASLAVGDVDNIGSIEGIDAGQRKDITSISTGAYLSFTLNATGVGWIAKSGEASACHSSTTGITCLGLREGHDLNDSAIGLEVFNAIYGYASERTGTSQDPYLDITYTDGTPVTRIIRLTGRIQLLPGTRL